MSAWWIRRSWKNRESTEFDTAGGSSSAGTLGYTCSPSISRTKIPSSLGTLQGLNNSSSFRDNQFRAASSTKCRRRTQIPPESTVNLVVPIRFCEPPGNVRTSDSRPNKITPSDAVKRCAIYTGSMYLDSAMPDTTVHKNPEGERPESSMKSSGSWSSTAPQTNNITCCRHSKRQSDKRRPALASVDTNVHALCASLPMPPFFHFSEDSFQSSALYRRSNTAVVHQPIVLELLTTLDAAISEWNTVHTRDGEQIRI